MRNWRIRHLLGNILILFSLLIFSFTYYPFIKLYLLPPAAPNFNQDYYISIPKIKAYAPIIINVNPWKKDEYLQALSKGVAQAKDNPSFFFAHSSDVPWKTTRYNTAFLRLGELQDKDRIIITKNNTKYQYQVTKKVEVWPDQIQYVKEIPQDQIILMTCTPVGTSLKRLLVFADLIR